MAIPSSKDSGSFKGYNYTKPIKNRLVPEELVTFDQEMQTFLVPGKTYVDLDRWLYFRGATTKEGAMIVKGFQPSLYGGNGVRTQQLDCYPILWEQCMEDYEQWKRWKHAQTPHETNIEYEVTR